MTSQLRAALLSLALHGTGGCSPASCDAHVVDEIANLQRVEGGAPISVHDDEPRLELDGDEATPASAGSASAPEWLLLSRTSLTSAAARMAGAALSRLPPRSALSNVGASLLGLGHHYSHRAATALFGIDVFAFIALPLLALALLVLAFAAILCSAATARARPSRPEEGDKRLTRDAGAEALPEKSASPGRSSEQEDTRCASRRDEDEARAKRPTLQFALPDGGDAARDPRPSSERTSTQPKSPSGVGESLAASAEPCVDAAPEDRRSVRSGSERRSGRTGSERRSGRTGTLSEWYEGEEETDGYHRSDSGERSERPRFFSLTQWWRGDGNGRSSDVDEQHIVHDWVAPTRHELSPRSTIRSTRRES